MRKLGVVVLLSMLGVAAHILPAALHAQTAKTAAPESTAAHVNRGARALDPAIAAQHRRIQSLLPSETKQKIARMVPEFQQQTRKHRAGTDLRALATAERFEREGLSVLKTASRERSTVSHRDASGLARAARGMLTQRDARVIEFLPAIKVPSLVMVGADDTPFLAASDYMAAKIPGAIKIVIPSAGHAVNIDQPQAFIDAVLPFLDGLPRTASAERVKS